MLRYIAPNIYLLSRPTSINTKAIDNFLSNYTAIDTIDDSTLLDILTLHVPDCLYALFANRDIEFYSKVLAIVGEEYYNDALFDTIFFAERIDNEFISMVNKLMSLTSIDQVFMDPVGKPFLAHIFKLPIESYKYGTITDDSAKWFMENYDPHMLPILITYDTSYLSKDVLQQMLDIAVRDREYIGDMSATRLLISCISNNCDVSKCEPLLDGEYVYMTCLIRYAADGKRASKQILDTCLGWPDYVWEFELGKSFFKTNFDKYAAINLYTLMRGDSHVGLRKLIDEYVME